MTKLWVVSDLHRDHRKTTLSPPAEADVAVIAGDICDDQFLIDLTSLIPVVAVAGNHDFYGHAHGERLKQLRDLPIHFLEDSSAVVGGVIFVGGTLWTDYGNDPVAAEAARRGMNDHRYISWQKEPWQRFLPSHGTGIHNDTTAYLEAEFSHERSAPLVVVTHHAPSSRSVHPRYSGQVLNRAYYSGLDDLVAASEADLWVHGHVHSNFDYVIGDTRVVCNPHGYPGENADFNPSLLIEVPT